MSPGDRCLAEISSLQRASRAKLRMRIGFALLLHVAARICFSRTAKIQTQSMSRSRRLTTRPHLPHRKRSGWRINCPGLSSTSRCRHSRRAHKPPEREKKIRLLYRVKNYEETSLLFISINWISVYFSNRFINKCFCGDQARLRYVSCASSSSSACGWRNDY